MQIRVKLDTMTPHLQQVRDKVKDMAPVMLEIGESLEAMTKKAFTNPALRPSPWDKKADGKAATLVKSGLLSRSAELISHDAQHALIGTDRPYAKYHQLGAPKANIPPRPFFPFGADGKATPRAIDRVKEILLRWLGK